MATKTEILQYITTLAEQKVVTKDELNFAFDAGCEIKTVLVPEQTQPLSQPKKSPLLKQVGIADILYYIGGAIVFLGIVILVGQNWSPLGPFGRLVTTFGGGIAAYFVGVMFDRDERTESASPAFFFISALVIPIGLFVAFDNAGLKASGYGYQTLISGIVLAVYLLSYFIFRRSLFVLFSILYGTWFLFSITSYLLISGPQFDQEQFYLYRILFAGLAYLFLGRAFSQGEHSALSGFLSNFGIIGFLSAALALGGWKPSQNVFWELIFPGLVFGVMFLSVHFKSKAFLVWGTIFLMVYLLKLTSEYFSRGLGWPFALVVLGLTLIGVGYASISIKRRYISV